MKLVSSDINWQKTKLAEKAYEARTLYEPNTEEARPYIGLEHIDQQTLKISDVGISSDTVSTKKTFKAGDILFGSLRPYFRKVARPRFDGVCSTDITVIRAKPGTDQIFLSYFIANSAFIDYATAISSGTRMPRASWKTLSQSEWLFPTLSIQRKIAAILSAYDDLIENNMRRIKILEEMAQLIYREWFVSFRFLGQEKVRMIDSPLGEIPEGWKVKKLPELVETQYGVTKSANEAEVGPKFLRGTDINKNTYIDWASVPYCEVDKAEFAKYRLAVGDVLVIRMADPGKVAIVEKDIISVFGSYLIRLKIISDQLTPYYLFYFLLSDRYQGYVTGASTGTTRKSASASVIVDIQIAIPPEQLRKAFEEQVSALRHVLNNLLDRNANLCRTRDMLLPKLISGELDVAELDIDVGGEAK
jgi:type I restriction enzyme S subunit